LLGVVWLVLGSIQVEDCIFREKQPIVSDGSRTLMANRPDVVAVGIARKAVTWFAWRPIYHPHW
jgi:hypothetical protein